MKRLLICCFLLLPATAQAGLAEVRDTARQNNCTPKKIEVVRQSVGATAQTTYQVECNLPKAKETANAAASSLVIKCELNLCQAMR